MLIQFGDLVSASIYASRKRDEGYFAEIIHLHAGHLYGPLPTMGFAVVVSEFAADDEEVPEVKVAIPTSLHVIGLILCLFSLAVVSATLLYVAYLVIWHLLGFLLVDPLAFAQLCLFLFILFILLSLYIAGLNKLIPIVREARKFHHKLFRATIVWVLILTEILF